MHIVYLALIENQGLYPDLELSNLFTVPKWVMINRLKIPQNLSAQIVCPSPKVWHFDEKRLHWASVVRVGTYFLQTIADLKGKTAASFFEKNWEFLI